MARRKTDADKEKAKRSIGKIMAKRETSTKKRKYKKRAKRTIDKLIKNDKENAKRETGKEKAKSKRDTGKEVTKQRTDQELTKGKTKKEMTKKKTSKEITDGKTNKEMTKKKTGKEVIKRKTEKWITTKKQQPKTVGEFQVLLLKLSDRFKKLQQDNMNLSNRVLSLARDKAEINQMFEAKEFEMDLEKEILREKIASLGQRRQQSQHDLNMNSSKRIQLLKRKIN